jgi:hypothetical protein
MVNNTTPSAVKVDIFRKKNASDAAPNTLHRRQKELSISIAVIPRKLRAGQ